MTQENESKLSLKDIGRILLMLMFCAICFFLQQRYNNWVANSPHTVTGKITRTGYDGDGKYYISYDYDVYGLLYKGSNYFPMKPENSLAKQGNCFIVRYIDAYPRCSQIELDKPVTCNEE